MMEVISIVPQFIHRKNGVFFTPDNNPHISADCVGIAEKLPPIKGRSAVPPVNEQSRPENAIGILRSFPDFICGLQMHLFDCVFLIYLILVSVKPSADSDRGGTPHDFCWDRFQHG